MSVGSNPREAMAEERLKRDGGERSADEESPTKKSRVASVLGPNSKVDDAAADKRHAGGETTVGDAEIGAEGDGAGVQDRATNKDTAATDCAQDLHPRRDVALASEARSGAQDLQAQIDAVADAEEHLRQPHTPSGARDHARRPSSSGHARHQSSDIFFTPDKRYHPKSPRISNWLSERSVNMAKGEPHTTPLPKQPCKKKIELDESTPYREIRYDPANKKSLERNLQVVTRDLNDFAAQPGNFDPEDPLGPEVSRKVREARAARFEMREHLEKIDRAERIAHEQRKQAREDAKFHAEQEKKRLRNKAAERDWPKRLSRDITPPSTSVKEARECFDEIRQERGGKNPYAARDWEADERRDRKKAEEEKGEREEQERRERFAASYKRSRMPFVPGRGRAPRHSGAGEGGDGSPKRPSRAPATGESRRRSSAPGRDASR